MARSIRRSLAAVAVVAVAVAMPVNAATDPLGLDALKTYNLVVLGDLTSTSEVEGRTFVGGNLGGTASNYLISSSVPASNFTVPGLTVVGSVTSSNINLNNSAGASIGGNVGGTVNLNGTQTVNIGGNYTPVNVNGSTVNTQLGVSNPGFVQNLQQYGSAMGTSMTGLSYTLGQQAANSTVAIANNTATFNAQPDASGTAVFNLTSAQLDQVGQIQFNLNGADTVIVNVSGSTINLNDNFLGNASQLGKNVIWNFTDATALTLTTAWHGSVLAPKAAAHTYNYVEGSAVFGSLIQDGEFHIGTYAGSYTPPSDPGSSSTTSTSTSTSTGGTSVPEPGVAGLMALGLAALAWRRRPRRATAA